MQILNIKTKGNVFTLLLFLVMALLSGTNNYAQDPNFYIYLCFGQSNMEGQGVIEEQDRTVDSRFQVMETLDCSNLNRNKGSWYTAVPPLCRCYSGLSPADYFGRTMLENLPDSIKIGIINVSIAGCKIELFDKDNYQDYISTVTEDWKINIINEYDGNPYQILVDAARLAQNDGVIKGILLHQGESNTNDNLWPAKVKKVYNDLLTDLNLEPDSVPLLAGEVVHADQGGICASMNQIIEKLPQSIPNSHIISSSGCTDKSDNLHFNSAGYREIGKRYAEKMLTIMGIESTKEETTRWVGTWSTAPYAAGNNTPPAPYLANNTLRQIVRTSIGGDTLRIKFSNRTCSTPVTMNKLNIAVSTDAGTSVIDTSTIKELKFHGNSQVTINPYSEVTSDPLEFPLTPGMRLAITIFYGQCETSADMTFHYGSRTDSYILEGDQTTSANFTGATTVERWYNLSAIDVLTEPKSAAIAVLGNSITDGYGLHGGPNNRWTHFFSEKLLDNPATSHVGVLNLGIGATWLTTNGVGRFQQDILDQSGLRWIIVFYGVNDIGGNASAENIINAFKNLIAQSHAQNIRIYGATITPFNGHGYYSVSREAVRQEVNDWIRKPGNFDKFIDFDKVLRDAADTTRLLAEYSNDWLHPNAAGYQKLGESVDINLFLGSDTLFSQPDMSGIESHYLEPECGQVGANWNIIEDAVASNGNYISVKPGIQSLDSAPSGIENVIEYPFTIDIDSTYYLYARLNCPTADDDSYWVKMDNGNFIMKNNLGTSGWQWMQLENYDLAAGDHKLYITYREDGACLDKLCISNSFELPTGKGEEAENICNLTDTDNNSEYPVRIGLEQNYPNPFNPSTTIKFQIPEREYVNITVYDILGRRIRELTNSEYSPGSYFIDWNGKNDNGQVVSTGSYIYTLVAGNLTQSKKLFLLK